MIIRYAFFQGAPRPGCEAEFARLVDDDLAPLWAQFPGAEEVRIMRPFAADAGAPAFAIVLAIRYPDSETMNAALQSPPREATRLLTQSLLSLFDGNVFHVTFDGHDCSLPL